MKITKTQAKKLAGLYPLPKVGYEIVVAIKPYHHEATTMTFNHALRLGNISGSFELSSTSCADTSIADFFGITL